jgi:protein gp37
MGCTKVSPACDGCYAEALMDKNHGQVQWGNHPRRRTGARVWNDPIRWQREAEKTGDRPFVFCASLADVYDNQVDPEWRSDAFDVMRKTPNLVYLLLTKRPHNIAKLSAAAGGLPRNAAIGTTVEDQKRANINVPALLNASVALWRAETRPLFTFVSCEPMLEEFDLTDFPYDPHSSDNAGYRIDALRGSTWLPKGANTLKPGHIIGEREYVDLCHGIDWVITGGETDQGDHKARPTHPDAFRSLRDQCAAAGVPYHHKQNGEWVEVSEAPAAGEVHRFPDGVLMHKVGKRSSGRLLDGVTHDEFPRYREAA